LTWNEKQDLLKKFDEWTADLKAQGVAKPSVRLFEQLYSKRGKVLRLLHQRSKLEGLHQVMPKEAAASRQRLMLRPFLPVESLLRDWLLYFRKRLIPVNIQILCLLAKDVYQSWIIDNGPLHDNKGKEPTWSRNWAQKFIKAWNIKYHKMKGEVGSVQIDEIQDEVNHIMTELDKYELDDIYNCDETGLYLKWLSSWTLDLVKASGVKPKRGDRVSVLLCTNATGTDKRKPFVLSTFLATISFDPLATTSTNLYDYRQATTCR
jgi:hypothetical protein